MMGLPLRLSSTLKRSTNLTVERTIVHEDREQRLALLDRHENDTNSSVNNESSHEFYVKENKNDNSSRMSSAGRTLTMESRTS